ncbi:B-lymphocyte antigen CD19 isoform X4 [Crotalus tigris]|uniref:B-lymphocyte antigen CD19 isoform X4 n=1 Tax=Crotalus tigris TaxID=88082 RepID=UPI00192F937B|nr:B-lymphocyte antigen CD19 isoform X4 [Crotalus tigris]
MASVLCSLLLLWLSYYWTASTEAAMETLQVIQVTEFQQVSLSCILDQALTSSDLDLIWLGPKRNELLYINVGYHHPEARLNAMWGLSLYRTGVQNTTWFTCHWNGLSGNPHMLPTRIRGNDSDNLQEKMKTYEKKGYEDRDGHFSDGNSSFPYVRHQEPEQHQHQEDLPHSAMDPKYFSCDAPVHRNWTDGTLLWIQHDSPDQNIVLINMTIRRSIRYSLDMNASLVSLILPRVTLEDAGNYSCHWKNQTCHFHLEVIAKTVVQYWMIWSVALGYMIVCLGSVFCFLTLRQVNRARRKQKKLMSHNGRRYFYAKRNKRSNRIMVCPGNDDVTEQVDAYENVRPDVGAQRGQKLLQKGKILPNTLKMEDDEHYENAQEEVKSGDVTLNDLRLQLALDIHKDRQDGGSEPSTGSQSYEEMNGSLCPTASKLFHLHTNTSNEEDADSYENMESPTSLNSRREGILDPHGESSPSGSRWQHISVTFGGDLRGGLLCSD